MLLIEGGGGNVQRIASEGAPPLFAGNHQFMPAVEAMMYVPVVGAVLGFAAGGPAGRSQLVHWSVMTKETSAVFAAGPPVVRRAMGQELTPRELGGPQIHVRQSGIIDNEAADEEDAFRQIKAFLSYMMCDYFHIPLVFFVDVPGFAVGPDAERAATLKRGIRAAWAGMQATVPALTIVVRKCYGMGGMVPGDSRLRYKIAWPSADWGILPIEGGVEAAYRREIESSPDPDARRRELEDEFAAMSNIFRTAEAFGVEEIIDPRETRSHLERFVEMAYRVLPHEVADGPKSRPGAPPKLRASVSVREGAVRPARQRTTAALATQSTNRARRRHRGPRAQALAREVAVRPLVSSS